MSTATPALPVVPPGPVPAAPDGKPQTLDELMLAMDVVDTLRHQDNLVARELDETRREAQLLERLREIYRGQGIEVSDAVLRQGVTALKESRFVYTPPRPSFGRSLAMAWINRGKYARALGIVVLIGGLGTAVWWFAGQSDRNEQARIEQQITVALPRALEQAHREAQGEARVQAAVDRADQLLAEGRAALSRRDVAGAERAVASLRDLRATLIQAYRLIVYNRPGQPSGVFRRPPTTAANRDNNYYLIVEAVGPDGQPLTLPIVNEENGQTERVNRWGQRVPRPIYEAVGRDKQDDGVIQRNLVGEKRRGALAVEFAMQAVAGATITRW
jgi:hypothetical protein